jgi:hypothetical protein
MHGYVPYHTKEYIARQALSRKERLVEGTSKAVSDGGRRQQVDFAAPAERLGTLDGRIGRSSSIPTFSSTVPTFPSTVPTFPSTVPTFPSTVPTLSSTILPQATKRPEVAYHNNVWNMPENITHSYPPQPQDVPLILPFETWPGYGTSNAIQNFPSAAQSPPSQALTPSDCTFDYYPDLHGTQPYTMPSQEQQFGESLTGAGDAMPPYNGDGLWNWPLQNWLLQ